MSKLYSFIYLLICISSQLFAMTPSQAKLLLQNRDIRIIPIFAWKENKIRTDYAETQHTFYNRKKKMISVTYMYEDYSFISGENKHSFDVVLPKSKQQKSSMSLKDVCIIINNMKQLSQSDKYSTIEELTKHPMVANISAKDQQEFFVSYMYDLYKNA